MLLTPLLLRLLEQRQNELLSSRVFEEMLHINLGFRLLIFFISAFYLITKKISFCQAFALIEKLSFWDLLLTNNVFHRALHLVDMNLIN